MRLIKLLLPRWRDLGHEPRDAHVPPRRNKRRAQRVLARMPILIYGRSGDEPFAENTQTVDVSSGGGLVSITARVAPSQKLIVTNLQTDEDLACRVVRLIPDENGRCLVGLQFLEPSPRFWRIDFVAAPEESGP
jgi:hypothetical protein